MIARALCRGTAPLLRFFYTLNRKLTMSPSFMT